MHTCPTCRGWIYGFERVPHTCPPTWLAWDYDDGVAEAVTIYASNAEEAAEKYACRSDEFGADDEKIVYVRRNREDKPTQWRVRGELTVTYSTNELYEGEEDAPCLTRRNGCEFEPADGPCLYCGELRDPPHVRPDGPAVCSWNACKAPATCYGRYEGHGPVTFYCDAHCDHDCKDGWCKLLADEPDETTTTEEE